MPELYLGLDVGTKNVKATIMTGEGKVVEGTSVPVYDLIVQTGKGFLERKPLKLWDRVTDCCAHLESINRISGVCVDATSGTIIPIDRDGEELHDLIMYNDSRAIAEAEELRNQSEAAREFEMYLPIGPQLVIPKLLWLRKNCEWFKKVSRILHEGDYIVYKITGAITTSSNIAGKSHALLQGSGYLRRAFEDVGLTADLMPGIKRIGDIAGFSDADATRMGLPSGTPVVNGVTDASAGDLTSGTIAPGQANATIGSTLVVHAVVDRPVPDKENRFYYKTYVNNTYLAGGTTNAGTTALDSTSKLLGAGLRELTDLARKVPVGSEGLIACTEWFGARVPRTYPNVRGFIIGMNERNVTPGHLFRSMLEGNAMALRLMLSAVEDVTRTQFRDLRVSGGASRNDLLMQVIADALGKGLMTVADPNSSLGSAMLAACGAGGCDLTELVNQAVNLGATFRPDPNIKANYDELADKYLRVVKALAACEV